MSVTYRGVLPEKNYSLEDFRSKGIMVTGFFRWHCEGQTYIRVWFSSNGLFGEIRTTCYGNTFAVDVEDDTVYNSARCLTTECTNVREAKSILYKWFESKSFSLRSDRKLANNVNLSVVGKQPTLHPFIFHA